jgi:hypothetical protein
MILTEMFVKKSKLFFLFITLVMLAFVLSQCTEKYPGATKTSTLGAKDGCETCHLDKDKLQKVADPIAQSGGESGEG